ncbi:hypothetical protein LQW54_010751 [Pestalotiopsis sp. IQ-011]
MAPDSMAKVAMEEDVALDLIIQEDIVVVQTVTPTHTSSSALESLSAVLADFQPADVSVGCDCLLNGADSSTTAVPILDFFTTSTITEFASVTASVTQGVTTETVSTTTVVAAPSDLTCMGPPTCNNFGLEWAQYHNDQGYNWDPNYRTFDPAHFKTIEPNATGQTSKVYVPDTFANTGDAFPVSVYDIKVPVELFVLNHRGYFYAPQKGTYNFSVPRIDDAAFVWLGAHAYEGWTRDNADISFICSFPREQQTTSASVVLEQGEYLPLRILFAQAQGGVSLQFQVTGPGDVQYLNSVTESPFVVGKSCDGTAPAYERFGHET